jgi:hypothetical protein
MPEISKLLNSEHEINRIQATNTLRSISEAVVSFSSQTHP